MKRRISGAAWDAFENVHTNESMHVERALNEGLSVISTALRATMGDRSVFNIPVRGVACDLKNCDVRTSPIQQACLGING
jgi:hypothetical protein